MSDFELPPSGISSMRETTEHRVKWLREKLRTNAALKIELAALERVLASMPVAVGDVVKSHKAPNIIGTVVTAIKGDEGEQVFARWSADSDSDTWIHLRDVQLVRRTGLSESEVPRG